MKKSRTRDVTYCSQIDKKGTENWCIELIPRSKYCKNYLRPKTNDTFSQKLPHCIKCYYIGQLYCHLKITTTQF